MLSRFFEDPFSDWDHELMRMRRAVDDVFGDTMNRRALQGGSGEGGSSSQAVQPAGSFGARWVPRFDVSETDSTIHVDAELPGMSKDEIKVQLDGNMLNISGETKKEKREESEQWHRVERRYGNFHRSMQLPDNCDLDGIKARHQDGVLSLDIPKIPEEQRPGRRAIDVE